MLVACYQQTFCSEKILLLIHFSKTFRPRHSQAPELFVCWRVLLLVLSFQKRWRKWDWVGLDFLRRYLWLNCPIPMVKSPVIPYLLVFVGRWSCNRMVWLYVLGCMFVCCVPTSPKKEMGRRGEGLLWKKRSVCSQCDDDDGSESLQQLRWWPCIGSMTDEWFAMVAATVSTHKCIFWSLIKE